MKDLMRSKCLISNEVETLLNQQIKKEAHSSSIYLAMASWCNQNGYDGSADYFLAQAEEERMHQMKLFKYLMEVGANAISPEVTNVKAEYFGFRDVFEEALEQEIAITQSFKNIVAKCHKEGDYVTIEFLNWFLKEQREEEFKARRAVELFDIIGEEGSGRFEIDKNVGSINYSAE